MTVTTRLVTAGDVVGGVAQVLQRAWPAPVIHYSADYCGWQFRFPGAAPVVAATFDGDRIVGSFAAVPRRIALGQRVERVMLVSFLAVDPDYQRRGIARELYKVLLADLAARRLPFVIFAKTGTPGQGLIESEPTAARFHGANLGDYVIHGFMARGAEPTIAVEALADAQELVFAVGQVDLLASRPDVLQLQHYAAGEHHRVAVARDSDGSICGAAAITRTQYANQRGLEWTTIVDSFLLPPTSPDALKALLSYAAKAFAADDGPALCTVPNVAQLDPEWFRPVGLRRTATSYSGIAYAPDANHPLLAAQRTNLEIV